MTKNRDWNVNPPTMEELLKVTMNLLSKQIQELKDEVKQLEEKTIDKEK